MKVKRNTLLLLACDAAPNTRRRCAHFAEAGAVPWTELPFSKAELGGAVGRSSCALAAVTDVGFASSLAAKLALLDQARYGDLSVFLGTLHLDLGPQSKFRIGSRDFQLVAFQYEQVVFKNGLR